MKFKTNTTVTLPEEQLQADYAAAEKQENLKLGEKCLYIAHTLYTEYVPYEAVERAYRRVEDVRGKLCCGVTTYEIHHLVIEAGGKEVTVLLESKEAAQMALDRIADKNPKAQIGYRGKEGKEK